MFVDHQLDADAHQQAATFIDLYEKVSWAEPDKKFAARDRPITLYREGDSPLRYKINRLGGRSQQEKWILQAELFNELHRWASSEWRKLGKKQNLPREAEKYYEIVRDFLRAAEKAWGEAWGHAGYMVTRPVTIKAMLRVCADLAHEDAEPKDDRVKRWARRLGPWTDLARSFKSEGFYERFPAKGQVERIGQIYQASSGARRTSRVAARISTATTECSADVGHTRAVDRERVYFTWPDRRVGYDCRGCGACCKGHGIGLDVTSGQLVQLVAKRPELAAFVRKRGDAVTAFNPRDRCWFLADDGLCRIEVEDGRAAKPASCRLFPFNRVFRIGSYTVVDYNSVICPLRLHDGDGVAHDDIIAEIASIRDAAIVGTQLPPKPADDATIASEQTIAAAIFAGTHLDAAWTAAAELERRAQHRGLRGDRRPRRGARRPRKRSRQRDPGT